MVYAGVYVTPPIPETANRLFIPAQAIEIVLPEVNSRIEAHRLARDAWETKRELGGTEFVGVRLLRREYIEPPRLTAAHIQLDVRPMA